MNARQSNGRRGLGVQALRWVVLMVVPIATSGTVAAAPEISIGPEVPLGFQSGSTVFPGGPPGEQQFGLFELRNTGTTKLTVTSMAITGPDAAIMAFHGAIDPFCGSGRVCAQRFSIEAGQSRFFPTTCTPTRPGVFSASLRITSNAASHHTTVPMTCLGNHAPVITVSPDGLDFGVVHFCFRGDSCGPSCATVPTTQSLTITNSALAPSELAFFFTGSIPMGPFGDVTMTPAGQGIEGNAVALRAGQSATFQFTFHPHSNVTIDGPLQLVSLFPGQPQLAIPFHAQGGSGRTVIDTPAFLGTLDYGQTLVTAITGHNAGNSCLSISSLSMSGMCQPIDEGPFRRTLAPGESFTMDVACTPNLENFAASQLMVEAPFEAQDIQFFDFFAVPTGGALISDNPGIEFTGPFEVPVGSSATVQLGLSNLGNDPTDLVTIVSTDPQFTATPAAGSLPLTLGPGESTLVDVAFTPTSAGRASGTITFGVSAGMGFVQPVLGDAVNGQAGATSLSTRQLAFGNADDPEIAPGTRTAGIERAGSGGCQTGGTGGLALIAGAAGLLLRRRRRPGLAFTS
jgi:MYXO-CTERM domain-containing protein